MQILDWARRMRETVATPPGPMTARRTTVSTAGGPATHRAARVLVVDDERALRETLAYNLRRAGYDVRMAANAQEALAAARQQSPDLILLDVLLPGVMDGFALCRQLRHELRCPIVLISALSDEVDRVVGLEVGADDYVTKPFAMAELLARVKAHLRRTEMLQETAASSAEYRSSPLRAAAAVTPVALTVGDLEIDPGRREVRIGGGRPIQLKRRQFDLLYQLARHAGMALSRSQLLAAVWPELGERKEGSRTVDVHMHRLRKHVERDPEHPKYLHTVRGIGYVLRSDDAPER